MFTGLELTVKSTVHLQNCLVLLRYEDFTAVNLRVCLSGMWHCIVWYKISVFRDVGSLLHLLNYIVSLPMCSHVIVFPESGSSRFLQNVGPHWSEHALSYPRRLVLDCLVETLISPLLPVRNIKRERDGDVVLMMLMIKGKARYCDCTLMISWHLL